MSFFLPQKCFTSKIQIFHKEKHMFYFKTHPGKLKVLYMVAGFIKNLVRMGGWAGRISTRSAQGLAHKVLRTRFAHKVPQGFAHKVFKGFETPIFLKVL